MRKSLALSALVLALNMVASSAHASGINCPGTVAGGDREFTLDTSPSSVCRGFGPGNINGNNDYINDVLDGADFWTTLDKSDDDQTGLYPTALTVGGGPNSGTLSFTPSIWDTYDRIIIALKSGQGQYDPDWVAFELVSGATSATWAMSSQGLSHVNLYGHLGEGTQHDASVPEPAALALFGAGIALAARRLRRRRA